MKAFTAVAAVAVYAAAYAASAYWLNEQGAVGGVAAPR
jgi:hypothetical protein